MPVLFIIYRVLGVLLLVLAAAALWEKYRTVRGAVLLPAQIVACEKAAGANPRSAMGGYCYKVEFYLEGTRRQAYTNDSFYLNHTPKQGQAVQIWYNPAKPDVVERKSWGTELLAAATALAGVALLLFR